MGNDSETRDSEVRDTVRVAADVTADHLGRIASIVATAARDIATELGKWVDDVATARAAAEAKPEGEPVAAEVKPDEKPQE
jgi:hypothetical protein